MPASCWYAVVRWCRIPSLLIKTAHTSEENCTPRSEVSSTVTPNLAIQPATRALAMAVAVVDWRGIASNHHVDLSTMVKRWLVPLQLGRGPTRLMWMWLKWQLGMMMGCTGDVNCCVTLPCWQCWQSLHQAAMLVDMPFQTQQEEMSCRVTLMPRWARLWTVGKTACRWLPGTIGLIVPVAVEHRMWYSPMPNLMVPIALFAARAVESLLRF